MRHWSTFQGELCVRQTIDTFNDLYDEAFDKKIRSSGYARQPTGLLSTKYVVMRPKHLCGSAVVQTTLKEGHTLGKITRPMVVG